MRRVKSDFISKKIDQAKSKGYITIELEQEPVNTGTYLFEIHQASFTKNIFVGDFLFIRGDLYDITNKLYICDCDSLLKYLKLNMSMNKDVGNRQPYVRELNKIIPADVGNRIFDTVCRIKKVSELKELFDESMANVVKDTYVNTLMERGFDVIHMKSPKFNEWFMDKDSEFEIDNLNLIPLQKFILVWSQRGSDLFGYHNKVTTIRSGLLITEVNKNNVDELLYDFLLKVFKIDDGKLSGKFDGEAQEFYDELYNKIYNLGINYYTCIEFQDNLAPIHYIMNSKGVSILEDEEEDLGSLKARMLLYYVSENLGNAREEGIDINVIEKKQVKKGKFFVEERRSTVVKSHIRKYKSGTRSLVRSHFRNGVNYSGGVCITF